MKKRGVSYSVEELARLVEGELHGSSTARVEILSPLDVPEQNCLSFFSGRSAKNLEEELDQEKVAALLLRSELKGKVKSRKTSLIFVADPLLALVRLVPLFHEDYRPAPGVSSRAEIDPSASLGRDVSVGAFVSIGANCVIGDRVTIHPHVTIYPNSSIGEDSIIHSNSVIREECFLGPGTVIQNGVIIGSDGFGYFLDSGELKPVPQVGSVTLGKKVEVGANSCVDRATLGATKIGAGTKLDNLVQVGHNVSIGRSSIICGQAGIAGSSKIGSGVVLGGQVGVADHLKLADRVRVAAHSGVTRDLSTGDFAGFPAVPVFTWKRQTRALAKLPELLAKLKPTRGKKG